MTVEETKRDPPVWLNAEFLAKALSEALNEPSLAIQSCHINPATAVGDNYASLMFRATLKITKGSSDTPEDLSIVCKTLPLGEAKDIVAEAFDVETLMLKDFMPVMNSALKNVLPNFRPLSAKCLFRGLEPNYVIILEDLRETGFALADRMEGLSMETTRKVLQAIAQLHAASLTIQQKTPELLQSLKNVWEDDEKDTMRKMLNSSLDGLIEAASEWDDIPADYLKRLKNLKGNAHPKMMETVKYNSKSLGVLQHGDCWVNNMMFKGDPPHYSDFRFVDFQLCHINSAGMDLNYFIFTSPSADIRIQNIQEMIEIYYTTFMDVSEKLGVEVPAWFTLDELKRDFRNHAFFGFVATIIVYPITITKKEDVMNVNDFFSGNTSKKGQYSSKKFKKVFKLVMPYFIECGVI